MSKRIPLLLGLLLLALALWLRITTLNSVHSWIDRLDAVAYDIQLRSQLLVPHHEGLQTSVAIVDIDDHSIKEEGTWPWPRSKLAMLINQLQAQGAVVIAFDVIFPRQEQNIAYTIYQELTKQNLMTPQIEPLLKKIIPLFDHDIEFATSLGQGDSVIGMTFLLQPLVEGVIPPPLFMLTTPAEKDLDLYFMEGVIGAYPPIEIAAKNMGFINVFPDQDGIIRRVPLLMNYKNGVYPSLALQAARIYLLKTIKLVTETYGSGIRLEGVQLGQTTIPTDERSQVIVPFRGRGHTFPFFSAVDVLNKKVAPDSFAGKIVFVGSTAVGLGDLKATSIQAIFPGVEINATVADAILKNNFPYKPAWGLGAEICLIFLVGIILLFLFPYLGPRILALLIFLIPLSLIFSNEWLYEKTGMIISILIPIMLTVALAMLNIVYGYLFETRRRERLKEIFGQYVPEKHIDEMIKSSSNYGLHGEDREMTVLFADIRHFTTLSEGLSAAQLKDMLSDFFTPMTEIIFKHYGTIDKYVGDLIMAFWGAPLKDKKHAEHALNAALDMQKEVVRLKPILAERGWPEIHIGVGLNTGTMSVGDMGSKFRLNYTVLGDAVNLSSRVESLTKYYGVDIMTTEFTQANQTKFVFHLLDRVRVKGKQEGVLLYEVVCRQSELTEALRKEIELSDAALGLYFQQEWTKAREAFDALNKAYPTVKLYSLYIERLAEFVKTPPPSDWDGVYTHVNK